MYPASPTRSYDFPKSILVLPRDRTQVYTKLWTIRTVFYVRTMLLAELACSPPFAFSSINPFLHLAPHTLQKINRQSTALPIQYSNPFI